MMTSAPEAMRREHERAGRLDAAHELDDDVGAEDERLGVGGEQLGREVGVALRARVAHRDADELDARADALRELVAVLEQQAAPPATPTEPAPRRPTRMVAVLDHAGVPSVERSIGSGSSPASRASRSASVSPRTITRASPSRTATTGGPAEVVVVARERPAVGAGRRHGEQVAGRDVARQVVGVDDDVARLAVLAGDAHERGRGVRHPRRDARRVVGAVERGAGVVAHAAVDRDVVAHGRRRSAPA